MAERSHNFAEDKFREMLRAAGCRVTVQRVLLLKLLHDCEGHVSADELYRAARARDSRLNLSTVYRTLTRLKETGLVNDLTLDGEHRHYELANKSNHHHLICQNCGKVIEIKCFLVDEVLSHIQMEHGFRTTMTQMEFTGYCTDCWQGLQSV